MGERYEQSREEEEFSSACTVLEVGQISCSSSQSFLCQVRAPKFPLRPESWKWAGRANKQRGGAHAHHTNTFTYVYSHKLKRIHTNNYMLKVPHIQTFATPSHLDEVADEDIRNPRTKHIAQIMFFYKRNVSKKCVSPQFYCWSHHANVVRHNASSHSHSQLHEPSS